MKILIVVLAFLFVAGPSVAADRYYRPNGSYAGRSVTSGPATKYYKANGGYVGRSETRGGVTKIYDGKGRLIGTKRR